MSSVLRFAAPGAGVLLRSAHACRGNAGTDEEGTTEPIEGGDDTRAGNEPARPRRDEAVGSGIGECESDEGGLEDEHLGPKIFASIEEFRQGGHEERQAL